MADITLTKYAGQLAARLTALRRSVDPQGHETGLQRIGVLRSNAGTVVTLYYDPSAHNLMWDDGTPVLSQQ